jgi:peptide deformylase
MAASCKTRLVISPKRDGHAAPVEFDRSVEDFHARVVRHQCDHLIGKLYPMRVRDFTRFGFTEVLFP